MTGPAWFASTTDGCQVPTGTVPSGMGGSQPGAPDISTMSPPEQATRLYEIVMSAHEQGDQNERSRQRSGSSGNRIRVHRVPLIVSGSEVD